MINDRVPLDDITRWAPAGSCCRLRVLRLDKIHPVVSGNKWFKLAPNLEAARIAGFSKVLSFGGGYSNHLVALAFAARQRGFAPVGIVRGQYPELTPSLQSCVEFGMALHFVSGSDYSLLKSGERPQLKKSFPGHWIIPEGGANAYGIEGASAIARLIPGETTDVVLAVGTGTTLAGLRQGSPAEISIQGYGVAKDMRGAEEQIAASATGTAVTLSQVSDPRFGRWKPELLHFMRDFFKRTGIALDVVYTAKMMQLLHTCLENGAYRGRDIVCIHTGGLQGNPAGLFT